MGNPTSVDQRGIVTILRIAMSHPARWQMGKNRLDPTEKRFGLTMGGSYENSRAPVGIRLVPGNRLRPVA
ncbi:MAG TPA: hypothetical protein PLJ27_20920 [Polyangiaceae bacterium]|nr:hypothetical protein [Polyangiaceae bacterium]HNZ21169.1 hypothetical protein [Polyangiaceae bacterium]HOD23693.1 hypothetical protein [Polyangiaceae bacterium]HOE48085.1 hypothetical protein [Polyangiaceae bacterium]HOG99350.1 hypothetical protein [Polyangiaceae bacterium]